MNLAAWTEYLRVQGGFRNSGTSRCITERGFGVLEAEKRMRVENRISNTLSMIDDTILAVKISWGYIQFYIYFTTNGFMRSRKYV